MSSNFMYLSPSLAIVVMYHPKIFCVYTGACVIFTYLWHITFFGGCMAVAGYAEKQNRHALSCCVVLPKSQAGKTPYKLRPVVFGVQFVLDDLIQWRVVVQHIEIEWDHCVLFDSTTMDN